MQVPLKSKNRRINALQNLAVFCQTSAWISHRYTYIYPLPFEMPKKKDTSKENTQKWKKKKSKNRELPYGPTIPAFIWKRQKL